MDISQIAEITGDSDFNYHNTEEQYLLNSNTVLVIKNTYKVKYEEIKSALLDYILALEAIYQN